MRFFVEGLDPKHIGVIHDVGNMKIEGFENPRLGLEILGAYLHLVHLKNVTVYPSKSAPDGTVLWTTKFWPMHQGQVNMREVVRAMLDIGYDGWVSFEDFSTQNPIHERMEKNITFIKRLVEEETAAKAAQANA